jgi:Fuc2NAc and GlcNAc transferase
VQVEIITIALGALLLSAALTGAIRRLALAHGLLDVPNQRSSHVVPTPRGGGVGIVVATMAGALMLALLGILDGRQLLALFAGGSAIALVGYFDDRRGLSSGVRLLVHLAVALATMFWLGGLPPMQVGDHVVTFGWGGYVLGVLGIVWSLNFFNFMDGIDGIAASEGAFVTFGGALIALLSGTAGALPALAVIVGAACCGFLLWNWPPAKIFMGDAGSGYLGYMIAVLALIAGRENPAGLFVWLILGSLFFVDATVTLIRRVLRGERPYQAHRSHAYQWLARRWASHRRVTVLTIAVNVLWLWPCAFLTARNPEWATWLTAMALAPIVIGASIAGAGRAEVVP